ncbi:ABC transporter substrate-binding protein [Microbacterium testaceum]|uniref:Thiamine biosynthesis protein n=1 Tax=Microbacterium testaceum TaxID=2033 RepID=A0A147F7G3_MICTE|nr:ABC transporter substrate-binding protein [Microbacterium testaceum]KTS11914.1 thiamine biosynthesis protein [Microbacterium testaceum]
MSSRSLRLTSALALAVLTAASLAACSSGASTPTAEGSAISSARCAENKDAGTITYLSGYQFQSSASILEYIAADKLGYFDDLCLDVQLQPGSGDTAQNTKLLASGQATVSAISQQDVLQARANGIDIVGISSYSDAGLDILMTNPDITALSQLNGKVVGHKGYVPATVRAMMEAEGVDWSSLTLVKQGYDPSVLPRRQDGLAALTGFISNEPNQLAAAGDKVTVWEPVTYGIPGSIGAMAVNATFAKDHPTAVQDVLRAALHAYAYCSESDEHTQECVGYAKELSGATYDTDLNAKIWSTETSVIAANPLPHGLPLGGIDDANVSALLSMLQKYEIVPADITAADAAAGFDGSFVAAIYDGDTLIWPAP